MADAHRSCAEEHPRAIRERVHHPYALVGAAYEEAQATGEIRDVGLDITVALFFSLIGGQMKVAEFGLAPAATPKAMAAAVADLVMHGIGA